jgi:hypothetical protein
MTGPKPARQEDVMAEYRNEASQAERKAVLENDNYHTRAQNTLDESGGRYTKLTPTNVTGTASAQVPKLPESSPWATDDPTGVEPPLGFSVDEMQPTGTPVEVAKSEER